MTVSTESKRRKNEMFYPSFEEVRSGLVIALRRFYLNDLYLLQEGAHERSMTFRLGMYLQPIFSGWDVDCEYNRNISAPNLIKSIPWRNVYPDVIIHRRGTDNNLLAIEAKPPNKSRDEIDEAKDKIVEYVRHKPLRYQFGLFIEFKDNFECTCADLQWYRRGKDKKLQWYDNDGIMIPPENRTEKQNE